MNNLILGKKGEEIAWAYLQKQGYKLLTKNFKSKLGEIDLIFLDHGVLVFVEVKTRCDKRFGEPEEAVTPWKIRSIIKTGQYFSLLHPELPDSLRIDVVAILMDANAKAEKIKLIKNATG